MPQSLCPCGSGDPVDACCGPLLAGDVTAPTAERLMRSRFTAFARADREYLLRTWHSTTRPAVLDLDPRTRWTRLVVHGTTGGGLLQREGTVEFTAFHRTGRGPEERMHQNSAFVRENSQWVYLS